MKKLAVVFLSLAVASLILGGCVVVKLTPDSFQSLVLRFKLGETVSTGQNPEVYTMVYPNMVQMRRKWLKISGQLVPPAGGSLPNRINVQVLAEHVETGFQLPAVRLSFDVPEDGIFEVIKKLKFNIVEGTMQTVRIEPLGNPLLRDTEILLCVDMFQTKKHARNSSDCGDDSPELPEGAGRLTSLEVVSR